MKRNFIHIYVLMISLDQNGLERDETKVTHFVLFPINLAYQLNRLNGKNK